MFLYFKKENKSIHQAFVIIKDSLKRTVSINLKQIIKEKTNCNKNYSPQFAFVLSQRTGQPQSQEVHRRKRSEKTDSLRIITEENTQMQGCWTEGRMRGRWGSKDGDEGQVSGTGTGTGKAGWLSAMSGDLCVIHWVRFLRLWVCMWIDCSKRLVR